MPQWSLGWILNFNKFSMLHTAQFSEKYKPFFFTLNMKIQMQNYLVLQIKQTANIIKQRMLKNLQPNNQVQQFKIFLMHSISKILKAKSSNSMLFITLHQFLCYLTFSCFLFINEPLEPKQASQIYKIFVLQSIPGIAGISQMALLIIFVVVFSTISIIVSLNFTKVPFLQVASWLNLLMPLMEIISVPVCYYTVNCISLAIENPGSSLNTLRIIFAIQSISLLLFTALFKFFSIRPTRYNNLLWNYENKKSFATFVFFLIRPIVFYIDPNLITLLAVSLVLELRFQSMPSGILNQMVQAIVSCRYNLQMIVTVSLFIGYLFDNQSLCFVTLCLCSVLCIISSALQYLSQRQQSEHIPKCSVQNCFRLYEFYICFKDGNKNTTEDLMKKVSAHYLVCNQPQCFLKKSDEEGPSKMKLDQLQQKISKYFKSFRYKNARLELMYEIWKIELNKSITLSHNLRQFSLTDQFIVEYVLGAQDTSKKNEAFSSISNLSNDSLNFKWKFYQQVSNAVSQFEKMGQILAKPLPELNYVIDSVISAHSQVLKLTKLFQQMITQKQVNYLCIELYLKFYGCFLNESKLSAQILDRLRRLKILMDTDQLEQNPLPCFLVEAYTNKIQKVNSQTLKFLKSHRYELKDKSFSDFIIPCLSPKQLYQFQTKNEKDQQIPIFFRIKTSNSEYTVCRNIVLKLIQINAKNYYEITVNKQNHGNIIIQLLVNDDYELVATTNKSIIVPFRQGKADFIMSQIFAERIKETLRDVNQSKIGRIEFGDKSLVSGMIIQKYCPYNNFRLIYLNLVKKVNQIRDHRRASLARVSKVHHQSEFSFSYAFDQNQNLILQGSDNSEILQQKTMNQNASMRSLIFNNVIDAVKLEHVSYGTGIKVYRLYQGELYNIDLEDRQKYQEQFDALQKNEVSSLPCALKINENCLIAFLILLALVVTGCSIFLSISIDTKLNSAQQQQLKLLQVQRFSLNFNRVMAVLRDIASGMCQEFKRDCISSVMDSYTELQAIDSSNFLSQQVFDGVYETESYQGTLSELIQVSLTHVYDFVKVGNTDTIQNIHNFCLIYLGPLLDDQKLAMRSTLKVSLDSLNTYCRICCIIIGSAGILYFILFVIIVQKFKMSFNQFLEPLLLKPQPEIRMILEDAQKFKSLISNLFKSYQVDPDSIQEKKQSEKKRQKPKKTSFGLNTILTEIMLGFFVISTLLCVTIVLYFTLLNETSLMHSQSQQGQAMLEIYSGLSWVTNQIEHLGEMDIEKLEQLSTQMNIIEINNYDYSFSQNLSNEIQLVFFNSSCSYLAERKIIDGVWCGNTFKGFTIQNPFQASLDIYFRRMIYNAYKNLTDSLASSGIYSDPFKQLFSYFCQRITEQTKQNFSSIRSSMLAIAIFINIVGSVLIVIFAVTVACFKKKTNAISNGLIFLIGNDSTKNNILAIDPTNTRRKQNKKAINQTTQQSEALIALNDVSDKIIEN